MDWYWVDTGLVLGWYWGGTEEVPGRDWTRVVSLI